MIGVCITDICIAFYFMSCKIKRFAEIGIILVVCRICVFIFGPKYWYYGYCLMFLIFGIIIGVKIVCIRIPLIEKPLEKRQGGINLSA